MTKNAKKPYALVFISILAAMAAFAMVKALEKRNPEACPVVPKLQPQNPVTAPPVAENAENKKQPDNPKSSMTLAEIAKNAYSWEPAYQNWYGKAAPDFSFTDISGKTGKLSDYKGKNVLLVFWATWCGPCKAEIPHIIALRNVVSADQLQIIAISNEEPAMIKQFAEEAKLNYTVTADTPNLPLPYNQIDALPSSFFIDKQGNIKFGTMGSIRLGEIKAILNAQR